MILVGGVPAAGTLPASRAIRVRRAVPADRAFAMALVPRLAAASPATWRSPRTMRRAYGLLVEALLSTPRGDSMLLVGERDDATSVGIAVLAEASDSFTHRRMGHLVQVAIRERHAASDMPVLLDAATAWARSLGLKVLSEDVFRERHAAGLPCGKARCQVDPARPPAGPQTPAGAG